VAVHEGDGDAVGSQVRQVADRVGRKARFSLLAVGDDRRPCCLKLLDGDTNRVLVESIEALSRDVAALELSNAFEKLARPGNAAYRFSRNRNFAHGSSPPKNQTGC
jgi:hypothetical protein